MIQVLRSGIATSIQDLGRFGYRKYGVPLAGSMDQTAAIQANLILGNDPSLAVIEMLVNGPQLLFDESCWICLSGTPISATCNQKVVPMYTPFFVEARQLVDFGRITDGRYSYLAIKGGILSGKVMQSYSYSKGITALFTLRKGMAIAHGTSSFKEGVSSVQPETIDYSRQEIRVEKGPEFDALPLAIQKKLMSTSFTVSNESNRMGYRLETSEEMHADEIITSAVQPGTVQMTPSGQLIVLMRDAQTTGGYSRVLQLPAQSISLIAQKTVGTSISFHL